MTILEAQKGMKKDPRRGGYWEKGLGSGGDERRGHVLFRQDDAHYGAFGRGASAYKTAM